MVTDSGYVAQSIQAVFRQPQHTEFQLNYSDFSEELVSELTSRDYAHIYQFIYEITPKEYQKPTQPPALEALTEPFLCETFWGSGSGFSANNSTSTLSLGEGIIQFPENLTSINKIRFDPSQTPCQFSIQHCLFQVLDKNNVLHTCKITGHAGFNNQIDDKLICHGFDPQIHLDCPIDSPKALYFNFKAKRIFFSKSLIPLIEK
ncbi:hypothetical protein N8865_01255 [Francisellaceae bacterium]|nr:hypothetical protein [Francisellaceae bacterium]